jgi:hypothetical protein
MFRENHRHLQSGMFDTFQQLPEKTWQRLEASWAGTFYREVFCRIKESTFAVLYSDQPSRPNSPINSLVGAEILKAGFGWSDEVMFEQILFNVQVRYALGLRDMSTVPFDLRTLYNFRQRLSWHMQETGENLLEEVFVAVTGEQLASLEVKTGHQRMDSVLVSSNIRQMTRLHLLVEVVQRVWRMLSEEDQAYYVGVFEPYRKGTAGQYCYRLKAEEVAEHLAPLGQVMHRLLRELEGAYAEQPTYRILQRVFAEHFDLVAGKTEDSDWAQVRVREDEEQRTGNLQSPDDWDATYRVKRGQSHRGYVANLTETCDPENGVQLITKVQVDSNLTDDEDLGVEAVPDLKARTGLAVLWTDGGYAGPDAEVVFREHNVTHMPTNLRGRCPEPERMGLASFAWGFDESDVPESVHCPGGQRVAVRDGHKPGRFLFDFDASVCEACPRADQCPAEPRKRRPVRVLRARLRAVQVARLRQRAAWARKPGNNRRSAIESTVRSVTHPFGCQSGKLPVRGRIRVTQVIICSALMVNLRRIWRHERELAEKKGKDLGSLLSRGWLRPRPWFHVHSVRRFPHFGLTWAKV